MRIFLFFLGFSERGEVSIKHRTSELHYLYFISDILVVSYVLSCAEPAASGSNSSAYSAPQDRWHAWEARHSACAASRTACLQWQRRRRSNGDPPAIGSHQAGGTRIPRACRGLCNYFSALRGLVLLRKALVGDKMLTIEARENKLSAFVVPGGRVGAFRGGWNATVVGSCAHQRRAGSRCRSAQVRRSARLDMNGSDVGGMQPRSQSVEEELSAVVQAMRLWRSSSFMERLLAQAPPSDITSGCCASLRDIALARLGSAAAEKRLPHRKMETWRFTDIRELLETDFRLRTPREPYTSAQLERLRDALHRAEQVCGTPTQGSETEPLRFVLLNGRLVQELSSLAQIRDTSSLQQGYVGNLKECTDGALQERIVSVIRTAPPEAGLGVVPFREEPRTHDYSSGIAKVNDFFTLLNAYLGMSGDGDGVFVVYLPPGCTIDRPMEIIQVVDAGVAVNPRTVIFLDRGTMASVSFRLVALGATSPEAAQQPNDATFLNECVNVHLETDACLKLSIIGTQSVSESVRQDQHRFYHMTGLSVRCEQGTSFTATNLNVDSLALRRLVMGVDLVGRRASCNVNGLTLLQDRALGDVQVRVSHHVAQCESNQLHKNVVVDRSTAVYRGTVYVEREADGTNAHQLIRSLLLSDGSRVHVMPFLEVLNDDVSCTHGAASAHLDEVELFYLQSRGASRDEARTLLLYGFVGDIAKLVPYPRMEGWIRDHLVRNIAGRAVALWQGDTPE